ncbi:hypothetical protein ACF0H5_007879 [Mactra antiquata]
MSFITQLVNVFYVLLIGLLTLCVWKLFKFVSHFIYLNKKLSQVPGLPRHWLLGNARKGQVENSKSVADIFVKAANAGHKVFCMWTGPIPTVGVIHPDSFKELNRQTREKSKTALGGFRLVLPWIGDGLLSSEGNKWERNRKLLTPAFHFDILNGYIDIMNDGSDILMDRFAKDTSKGNTIDIFPYVCKMTLDSMLRCSLSYSGSIQTKASESEEQYIEAVKRLSEILVSRLLNVPLLIDSIFYMLPIGKEFRQLCDRVHQFTGNIIQSRTKELSALGEVDFTEGKKRRLDFLDILLTAKDNEGRGLSPQEIQDEVDTFTFEGHDTTASAISWAIYALGKYPDLQQKVYKDVCNVVADSDIITKDHLGQFAYMPKFIKEVMRYFSPVPVIERTSNDKPVVIDGVEIPPNVSTWIHIYALHHNESVWPNHTVFDPERFDAGNRDGHDAYSFIPFSAGSRNCIGQVFAMNEIKINIAKVVKRFEITVDPSEEPVLLPNVVMRAENGLNVGFKPRK